MAGLVRFVVDFINQSKRVMKVAKKPAYSEFERMFRIVSISAFAIGLLGFIISFIFSLL